VSARVAEYGRPAPARDVPAIRPDLTNQAVQAFIDEAGIPCLEKPSNLTAVLETVRLATERPSSE